jgi:hypothetical protein
MLQKKGDPITRVKVIATGAAGPIWLDIPCFVTAAGAVSQNGITDHGYDRDEYDHDQYLDGGQQEAAQRKNKPQQRYYQQN